MNKFKILSKFFVVAIISWLGRFNSDVLYGEEIQKNILIPDNDSLSLNFIIKRVIDTHPTIKEAEEALNIADTKINFAKSGYYPYIGFDASYTRLGPMSYFEFPGLGKLDLYPANNYNIDISVKEKIYDFGKREGAIDIEYKNKELTYFNIELAKQKLALRAVLNYYTLLYLQSAIEIKNEQIKTLAEHLEFIRKKEQTGSATRYEILSTQVKISAVQSQKTNLECALKNQQSILNSLLGQDSQKSYKVRQELNINYSGKILDSLISFAGQHREEIQIAKQKTKVAQMKLDLADMRFYPVINLFANAGWKNGFFPEMFRWTANYVAGVEMSVPIFDATISKNKIEMAKSEIVDSRLETEISEREITDEVVQNESNRESSLKIIQDLEIQLKHSEEAFNLAKISYNAGTITNLDLLDAETNVSESRIQLLKGKIDLIINIKKLDYSIGESLY